MIEIDGSQARSLCRVFSARSRARCAGGATLAMRPLGVALAIVALTTFAARAEAPPALATIRALAGPLGAGKCAEAAVQYVLPDPLGGATRTVRGTVAVESPDCVRLDFTTTGERITLRPDGGEWLQPAAKQLVKIPASRAEAALFWWRVLLPESGTLFREDSIAPRRFRLTPLSEAAGPLHVSVTLDARGLPQRLAVEGGDESAPTYRFSGWRFTPAKGPAAYRLAAPAGYEVVDLP